METNQETLNKIDVELLIKLLNAGINSLQENKEEYLESMEQDPLIQLGKLMMGRAKSQGGILDENAIRLEALIQEQKENASKHIRDELKKMNTILTKLHLLKNDLIQ